MGVYRRKESPFWYCWLDGAAKPRINTKIPIGTTDADQRKSRRLAEQVYHALMADRARGRFGLARELPRRTFLEHRTWYAAHVSNVKRGTTRELSMLRQLGAYFDPLPLTAIDQTRVREWRAWRTSRVSVSTVRREEALLKHLLSTAVPTYVPENPLVGMTRVRVPETDTRVLSHDEEARILRALDGNPEGRALVLCALVTLLRLGNARALTRAQDHGTYLFSDTKHRSVRIPISTALRAALDALPNTGPQYFPTYAKDAHGNDAKRMFRAACVAAQVQTGRKTGGVSFHCLRHTGATRMLAAGVDIETVRQIGGWASLAILKRYLHPADEAKRAAVETISAGGSTTQIRQTRRRKAR